VPLSRPPLALVPGPRSVQDARRWVVRACRDIERDDLVECAELGVSELVTNALLHAEAPISVRVRGTRQHPRVEVRDASPVPPVLPEPGYEPDEDLLLTFGRGLTIVARASDAWGVEVEEEGKVVWFAPAAEFAEEVSVEGRISGVTPPEPDTDDDAGDLMSFSIIGVPVEMYLEATRHFGELRREIRLLALAHQQDYPLAKSLSDVFTSFDRPGPNRTADQVQVAQAAGRDSVDLELLIPGSSIKRVDVFRQMLELADEFCRSERLLSLARTDEQRAFQNWFLSEFVRQNDGHEPTPWQPSHSEVRETSAS
jgi:anti-sigma regulatory factor (Ser/Thr protein kinase)